MIHLVQKYQELIDRIPKMLEETNYKTGFIISEIGVAKPTFYRKLKNGNWTTKEVMKLLELIEPKEYYRYEFEQEINAAEADLDNGDIIENDIAIQKIEESLTK